MSAGKVGAKRKLLFVVTEDWYFVSHRLALAIAAIEAGYDVSIATRINSHGDIIRDAGIGIYPWNVSRGSTGLWAECKAFHDLLKIYLKVRPDLVHHVALKPVLYGGLAAKLIGPRHSVNALGGMGSIFNDGSVRRRRLRSFIATGLKWILSGKDNVLILQNRDDRELMINEAGVDAKIIRLIRGVGVDVHQFSFSSETTQTPLVVLPARMLWDKGVAEYVEAAKLLRSQGLDARFALVGGTDECNPSGISLAQLQEWAKDGIVEWHGQQENMAAVFQSAHIVCLPSYREGLPKALLEAAACGRAIVTTDVPGCREVVQHGENGLLVPARDYVALASALKILILDPALRASMGRKGHELASTRFSQDSAIKSTLAIYDEIDGKSRIRPHSGP